MTYKRSTERGPGSNQYSDKPPLSPSEQDLVEVREKSAGSQRGIRGLVEESEIMDETERQRIILEEQNKLNTMWLSPHDRTAIEDAMMSFGQSTVSSDQKLALEELRKVVEMANISAEKRYRDSTEAQIMLNDLGHPTTEEGIWLSNTLQEVAAGISELPDSVRQMYEQVRVGEVQRRRTSEVVYNASAALRHGLGSFEDLQRHTRNLYESPPEYVFPRIRSGIEDTAYAVRRFRQIISEADPETVRRMDYAAENINHELNQLENIMGSTQADFSRRGRIESGAYESMSRKMATLRDLMSELEMTTRATMSRF